jgi:hypothetical protein
MQQFVFGHQPPGMFGKIAQHRKGLGPQRDHLGIPPQLLVGEIEMKRWKTERFRLHSG